MIKYIADREHYTEVLSRCEKVKHDLWIGTADLGEAAPCQRARRELPRGLRQVSWVMDETGA